jgi:hypothetical protein
MADLSQAFSEVKSLPDHILEQELKSPSGMIPGWLALGEIHERKAMRATHGGSADPTKRPSMAEQYAGNIQPIIAGSGMQPPPQQMPPQGMPPQQPGPPQGIAALPQQPPQGYANGGIISLASGGFLADRIRQIAAERGFNPDVVLRVVRSEGGLSNPYQHGLGPAPKSQLASFGPTENSYGPLQLYISGTGAGLGDRAVKAGFDPRKDWEGGFRYALDEVRNRGWGQWYGAKKAGITGFEGVDGRPANYSTAAMASSSPTAATNAVAAAPIAATDPTAMMSAVPIADTAADTAGTAAAGGADPMSQIMLATMLMGGKGQPQAAPPAGGGAVAQGRPVDASLYVQNPAFMERMRRNDYG